MLAEKDLGSAATRGAATGTATELATQPPPKYSRYRSVRRAAQEDANRQPEINEKSQDAGVARSMSRYRRARPAPKTGQLDNVPMPAVPAVPKMQYSKSTKVAKPTDGYGRMGVRRVTDPSPHQRARLEGTDERQRHKGGREPAGEGIQQPKARELGNVEEQQRSAAQHKAAAEAEAERILAEQKKKDLERLEAELEAAAPSPRVTSPSNPLKFFSRKRGLTKTTPPPTASSGKTASTLNAPMARSRTRSSEAPSRIGPAQSDDLTRADDKPKLVDAPKRQQKAPVVAVGIEQGGGGIVPQIDAPISASNAGERRVLIRCRQSSINLPINPDTTPVDLVFSAANVMTQDISTSSAILLESYTQLGLERRIRKYERIRDIMNSWDRDTQNALILENSDSPNFDTELEATSIPKEAPSDVTLYMYHSQKPGKWNKRHITLLSTGQIFMSKKAGSALPDKDVINLCHLSDFDIYTITPQQTRKVLRPPKKHCYAIKSQQKTTMFLSTENFVHFFSTDDQELATQWYDAVQHWRSWYLVNKMGEGSKAKGKTEILVKARNRTGPRGRGHAVKVSLDENPYTIGSFQPLMDLNRFDAPPQPAADHDSEDENQPRQIPFHLRNSIIASNQESLRHPPPVSYKLPPKSEEEFASSGLLGRSYSQRLKVQKEREAAATKLCGPFVEGPSLLNGAANDDQRSMSMKSSRAKRSEASGEPGFNGGLHRNQSQLQKPKPLLNFTPEFKEAPQWDKKGKGHGVKPVEGLHLVDAATGPDVSQLPGMPRAIFRREEGRPKHATAATRKERTGSDS